MPDAPSRISPPIGMLPRSTYRLQFHRDFPFAAGRDLAAYLRDLGISHVYSSPILTARAGSQHGYDVVSYDAINPELGGEDGFREMAAALRAHGIGIVLDIVPNHVAVGGDDNALWLDLLRHGRSSRYAGWFDVDFDIDDETLRGKVLAPFLGRPWHEALARGELRLAAWGAGYAIAYGEHIFPIRPEDEAGIAQAGIEASGAPERLGALIERQNFRLDWWRNAGDRINWRRFFDITHLAAIRMEVPEAFEAAHAIMFRLYGEGLIDGVRVDHIDGLSDPAGYCRQLRRRLDEIDGQPPGGGKERAWLVVEKILAEDETLPGDWGVDGTTGYDFMAEISALQHDEGGATALAENWARVGGRSPRFDDEERSARRDILRSHFAGQRDNVVAAFQRLAARHLHPEAITRAALSRAVTTLIENMRVYRSYATGRSDLGVAGVAFEAALASALRDPSADQQALHFIAEVVSNQIGGDDEPARANAVRKLNQLTAPVAAKAVEDTAFYRYGRLLSRNDVGFDPGQFSLAPGVFHARMQQRAKSWPRAMLASATHDHKRGEDVRARLAVISEMPGPWQQASREWFAMNERVRPDGLDPGDEYMLYQMLVGAWPLDLSADDADGLGRFAERIAGWWQKALREGKLRSGWAMPNDDNEAAAAGFVGAVLAPGAGNAFLASILRFVDRIAAAGALNGLAQLTLKSTLPGVPDTYQGTEYWDFSLVDPDNRRPVDYASRRVALAQEMPPDILAAAWRDGRVKQLLLRRLLGLRRTAPGLFAAGNYEPLEIVGPRSENAFAFMRRHGGEMLIVAAARCAAAAMTDAASLVPSRDWWQGTRLALPSGLGEMSPVLGPELAGAGGIELADAFAALPVAVWFRTGATG